MSFTVWIECILLWQTNQTLLIHVFGYNHLLYDKGADFHVKNKNSDSSALDSKSVEDCVDIVDYFSEQCKRDHQSNTKKNGDRS